MTAQRVEPRYFWSPEPETEYSDAYSVDAYDADHPNGCCDYGIEYDDEPEFTYGETMIGPTISMEVRTEHASADLSVGTDDNTVCIWSVRVADAVRGQGYGKRLMQEVIKRGDMLRKDLELYVYIDNTVAINLYRSVGFEVMTTDGADIPAGATTHRMFRPRNKETA